MQLSNHVQMLSHLATTSGGTSDVTGAGIDMAGAEGVLIIAKFGTAASGNKLKAQQSSDDGSTDSYGDLEGSAVGVGSSDEIVWLDIYRPTKRWVKAIALRGTSSTLDWGIAIRYGLRNTPVDNTVAGTIHGEVAISPAEGTA